MLDLDIPLGYGLTRVLLRECGVELRTYQTNGTSALTRHRAISFVSVARYTTRVPSSPRQIQADTVRVAGPFQGSFSSQLEPNAHHCTPRIREDSRPSEIRGEEIVRGQLFRGGDIEHIEHVQEQFDTSQAARDDRPR